MIPIYRLRFASEAQDTAAMDACSLADDPRVVPVLQYLSDCTHRFAGQTLPLPEINHDY